MELDSKLKTRADLVSNFQCVPTFIKFGTLTILQIEHADYEYNTPHCLGRLRDYWPSMIIGCKIRLSFRT